MLHDLFPVIEEHQQSLLLCTMVTIFRCLQRPCPQILHLPLTTYVTRDAADCEDSDNVADWPDGVHLYDARQPRHHRHHGGDQDGIQVTQNNGSKYFYSACKNIMCHLWRHQTLLLSVVCGQRKATYLIVGTLTLMTEIDGRCATGPIGKSSFLRSRFLAASVSRISNTAEVCCSEPES